MNRFASLGLGALALVWAAGPVHAAGEPEVRTTQIVEEGSNISWGHAVAVIDNPIDEVLPVVVDYANYVLFMPNFTTSKVLAQRGNRAMVYMEVSVASGTLHALGPAQVLRKPFRGRDARDRGPTARGQHARVQGELASDPGRWWRPNRGRLQDLRRPRHALALIGVQP